VSELEKTRGAGRLYLCATPIGNLEDITLRALRVLREVDWIAAEDTRHTLKLLRHYDIRTPVISYHEHNEAQRSQELIQRLLRGEEGALVSDAGTPVISDPGYPLVRLAIDSGVPVIPLPGPSALTAALIVSGLPPHPFYFGGFLPRREKERRAALQSVGDSCCHAGLLRGAAPAQANASRRGASASRPARCGGARADQGARGGDKGHHRGAGCPFRRRGGARGVCPSHRGRKARAGRKRRGSKLPQKRKFEKLWRRRSDRGRRERKPSSGWLPYTESGAIGCTGLVWT